MNKGLIFTDTEILSDKLGVEQTEIQNILSQYVEYCSACIEWNIVDIADPMYADRANSDNWSTYLDILSDYYYGLGLNSLTYCPLFIIGDNEEIPMPLVENPNSTSGEFLMTDMLYCFQYENISSISPEVLVNQIPRFAVGRLPITSEQDVSYLINYLNRSIDALAKGISVRGAAMTTAERWIPASTEIMRDIPTSALDGTEVPLNNRMIVSPTLDTAYQDMYDRYVGELKKVDFLVCNLHGGAVVGYPEFSGEGLDGTKSMVATQPSMLKYTCPPIFNTLACYGARFIGYSVDDSMLLTALENGTILYTGACANALGGGDNKAGCSELLIKLYNIYLHQGTPAGMALMRAKQDYYRTCHHEDGDNNAMYTILEFNLFGCPILAMQPKLDLNYRPLLLGRYVDTSSNVKYSPNKYIPVSGSVYDANDILSYVRSRVDANLSLIRSKVEKQVYERLGLRNITIYNISYIMQYESQVGYQFVYVNELEISNKKLKVYYYVTTNNNGDVTKILSTK